MRKSKKYGDIIYSQPKSKLRKGGLNLKSRYGMMIVVLVIVMSVGIVYSYDDSNINILILNSYDSENVWTRSQIDGIVDTLNKNNVDYSLYVEYMDTKRFYEDSHLKQIFNYLYNKYIDQKIDYVIATDDSAFSFLNNNSEEIFGEAKLIFSGLNYIYEMDRSKFTGVYEKIDIKTNIEFALKLFPGTQYVYLIGEDQVTTRSIALEVNEYLGRNDGIDVEIVLSKDIEFLKSNIDIYPDNTIVFFTIFNLDDDGNRYSYEEGFEKVMSGVDVPIFSFWSFYDGLPIVGGYVSDGYLSGVDAANMLIEIFEGASVSSIEILESRKVYKLNYDILEKFNVNSEKLEEEIEYINKPISFFKKNRAIIIVFCSIIILLCIIILLLYRNNNYAKENVRVLTENKKIQEKTNIRLETEVEKRIDEYEKLQKKVIETEKMASLGSLVAGISHEINTPIGIAVTGSSFIDQLFLEIQKKHIRSEMKKSDLDNFFADASEMNSSIIHSLEHAVDLISSFKKIAVDQSSSLNRNFDIKGHIEEIITSINYELKRNNIELDFNSEYEIMYYGDPSSIFQILMNLINNSLIHAYDGNQNGLIRIELSLKNNEIEIIYSDDGIGIEKDIKNKIFDPFFTTKRGSGGSGLGLNIVYNIVTQRLNGSISCESQVGEGTKFIIIIPQTVVEREVGNG